MKGGKEMRSVILYSNNCPKCRILKQKLDDRGIEYALVDDIQVMLGKGMTMVPVLEVGGVLYEFSDAVQWVKSSKGVVK